MSHMGKHYFHTDSDSDLEWLESVIRTAREFGEGVRLLTVDGKLQVARGGSGWTTPLAGTPCHKRDETLDWQSPWYKHTHVSVHDGSPAMLVKYPDARRIRLVNEDGHEWTDLRADWQPID